MKSNQIQTRMAWEDIETIAKLARKEHMTPAAMLRRLALERLEQIAQSPLGSQIASGETSGRAVGKGVSDED